MRVQNIGIIRTEVQVNYDTGCVVLVVNVDGWVPGKGQDSLVFTRSIPFVALARDGQSVIARVFDELKASVDTKIAAATELLRREETFRAMNENRERTP